MNPNELHPAREQRRGTMLLGVAAAAAVGVLWTALSVPGSDERVWVDTAPPAAQAPAPIARLDDGVDWARVAVAPNAAPLAVAAYEGVLP